MGDAIFLFFFQQLELSQAFLLVGNYAYPGMRRIAL
jgi:hypothetical protein